MTGITTFANKWEDLLLLASRSSEQWCSEEASPQESGGVCVLCDAFERMIDCMSSSAWLERDASTTDLSTLYSYLRDIDRLDAEWSSPKGRVDGLESLPLLHQLHRALHRRSLRRLTHHASICQSRVRDRINALSRHALRPLGVLDLPDELLVCIFEHLRCRHLLSDYDDLVTTSYPGMRHTRDIQNARLTCRRFCATSSHLLLRHLDVLIRADSISRLHHISQSPLIRNGVHGVRIQLGIYSSEVATNLQTFARMWTKRQYHVFETHSLGRARPWRAQSPDTSCLDYDSLCQKYESVGAAWDSVTDAPAGLAQDGGDTFRSKMYVDALKTCHGEYRQHYEDQQELLESGDFVLAVTSALANMPSLRYLSFEDGDHDHEAIYDLVEDPVEMGRKHIRYLNAGDHYITSGYELPVGVIIPILVALSGSAVKLQTLRILLRARFQSALLLPRPTVRGSLVQLAGNLERFLFRVANPLGSCPTKDGVKQFLSTMLEAESLELIHLCGIGCPNDGLRCWSIGPMLNSRRRTRLRDIYLLECFVHGEELEEMISFLEPESDINDRVDILLLNITLLSGRWASILDLLRGRAGSRSGLINPQGGEFDPQRNRGHPGWYGVSEAMLKLRNRIHDYIMNPSSHEPNPIRAEYSVTE
ncbi:hypothetical protein F4808DRAFT_341781 [Astrocystis sublimbata]|nr:hypothetical protein F4808DRAFT_341781 [Astrocystis sublimbata]